MAGNPFTSPSQSTGLKAFNGGLNSTAGPLGLKDNESSDLLNVDFNKFGSILKRNGYLNVNTTATTGSNLVSDGLHWFEWTAGGTANQSAINVAGGQVYQMNYALNGTWNAVTAGTLNTGYHCDFENFLNKVYVTNGINPPFEWAGTGTCASSTVPTNLTTAKFVKQFNNYLFYANVTISNVIYPTRIYWSAIRNTGSWSASDWIDISKDDGQEITGLRVLSDRLVIYKTRSIYNVYFSGDPDIPFVLPGGGKSNSPVGCIAPYSIQEVENGHVFLSYDGLWYYDGVNAYKISDRINDTIASINVDHLSKSISMIQRAKNRYYLAVTNGSSTTHDSVIVWDWFNNAFSLYDSVLPSSMATFHLDSIEERPYFCDYSGYLYRLDYGTDDYPLKVKTAINAYYYTNWRNFDDLVVQKGVPEITIYYTLSASTLTLAYSYDFENSDTYTQSFSMNTSTDVWDTMLWNVGKWAASGGYVQRRDLTGRGRVVRFKFANANVSETMRIDGLGAYVHAETQV